jgi:2-oxoglutarate ferredoxin oxidoreductase subunit beta
MPSVLTGANLANREPIYSAVRRRGFRLHRSGPVRALARRGVNMVYIVENNGVYGLTKGQFSATADKGSKIKGHGEFRCTDRPGDDGAALGATFVARSFSGDKEQLHR